MTEPATTLVLSRCETCRARFLPTDTPCPRCGSTHTHPYPVPPLGRVMAATELAAPAPGWTSPHRLALVEVSDGVRILAVTGEARVAPGDAVVLEFDGTVYRAKPAKPPSRGRGEGESPKARSSGPSFEPPR